MNGPRSVLSLAAPAAPSSAQTTNAPVGIGFASSGGGKSTGTGIGNSNSGGITCIYCSEQLVGIGRMILPCRHESHIACALMHASAGRLYCTRCARDATTASMASALDIGFDAEASEQAAMVLRQHRAAQVGTREQRVHYARSELARLPPAVGCSYAAECRGGDQCAHRWFASLNLSHAAMAASIDYDYGGEHMSRIHVANWFREQYVSRGSALRCLSQAHRLYVAAQCGVDAALLAFATLTVDKLVEGYGFILEDLIDAFALDWRSLCMLGFHPRMMGEQPDKYPLIALYDARMLTTPLNLLAFTSLTGAHLHTLLGKRGRALLGFNLIHWR